MSTVVGVCQNCAVGNLLEGEPAGTMVSTAYLAAATESGDVVATSKKSVVLLTDAFGLPVKNCSIVADKLSRLLGCDVWVPDLFNGTRQLQVLCIFQI